MQCHSNSYNIIFNNDSIRILIKQLNNTQISSHPYFYLDNKKFVDVLTDVYCILKMIKCVLCFWQEPVSYICACMVLTSTCLKNAHSCYATDFIVGSFRFICNNCKFKSTTCSDLWWLKTHAIATISCRCKLLPKYIIHRGFKLEVFILNFYYFIRNLTICDIGLLYLFIATFKFVRFFRFKCS